MSEKTQAIKDVRAIIEKNGLNLNNNLQKQIDDLANPHYRVAVVGKYQVGKSTLINKVFLGDSPILATGKGLCTTAVVTEICHGDKLSMEQFQWADCQDEDKRKIAMAEGRETSAIVLDNPTAEDVKEATVSNDREARKALSQSTSRIKITAPIPTLQNYTLLDTPGIDDPLPELLNNTTYRIIPGVDLAILVVACQPLDQSVMELLRKRLIDNGVSRLMVLVSYQPVSDQTEENRKMILDNIKAQLANIGRENIPIDMYCFDESVDMLMNNVDKIRLIITSFLEQNALPGREEKVAFQLRRELQQLLLAAKAKCSACDMSDEQRRELQNKIDQKVLEFQHQTELIFEDLNNDFTKVEQKITQLITVKLNTIFGEMQMKIDATKDLEALQTLAENGSMQLQNKLNEALLLLPNEIKKLVSETLVKHKSQIEKLFMDWSLFLTTEFNLNSNFLAKIPNWAWEGLNVVALNLILPGGWIPALIGRVLFSKIGGWDRFLINGFVKGYLAKNLKEELDKAQHLLISELQQQVNVHLQELFSGLKANLEETSQQQVDAIRTSIIESPEAAQERQRLEQTAAALETALNTL